MVEINKEYNVDITGITHDATGIAVLDGIKLFVGNALPGESVRFKVSKVTNEYAAGYTVDIIQSPFRRVQPFCSYFGKCGGCALQHIEYDNQLKVKTWMVKEALKRYDLLQDVKVHDTLGMDIPYHYRNKAQYHVGMDNGVPLVGFYGVRSNRLFNGEQCLLMPQESENIINAISEYLRETGVSIYNNENRTGVVRGVVTRISAYTKEIMVIIVINGNELPHSENLISKLKNSISKVDSLYININTGRTSSVLGPQSIYLYGKTHITDRIGKYNFIISPLSFFQVNPVQTEVLYNKVMDYAELAEMETVLDLFCGIGTISIYLSEKASKVYGVEFVGEAVNAAVENAKLNGVGNTEFITGRAEQVIQDLYEQGVVPEIIVIDPPRKGLKKALLDTLVLMTPKRIIYVSCNPSTMAADLNYLTTAGYKAIEVQPIDMFPHSGHTESVARIEHRRELDK